MFVWCDFASAMALSPIEDFDYDQLNPKTTTQVEKIWETLVKKT